MHRLVLVGWNEVFARVKAFALTVEIDPKRRLLREGPAEAARARLAPEDVGPQ